MKKSETVSFDVINLVIEYATVLENNAEENVEVSATEHDFQPLYDYLGLNEYQTKLFVSVVVLESKTRTADVFDISRFLKLNTAQSIIVRKELREMLNRGLLVCDNDSGSFFSRNLMDNSDYNIHPDVSAAMFANRKLNFKKNEKLDIYDFCSKVAEFIDKRSLADLDSDRLFAIVSKLERKHISINAIKKITSTGLSVEERTILYEVLNDTIQSGGTRYSSFMRTIHEIFDKPRKRLFWMRKLIDKNSTLFQLDFLVLGLSVFTQDQTIEFTPKGLEMMLEKDAELFIGKKGMRDVIKMDSIGEKELFFEGKLKKDVDLLHNMLQPQQYDSIINRLNASNMPPSVNVLFHGYPGTGKTELCYQLARATGRNIMQVDLSQARNLYFGESEKKVREIFLNYAKLCKNSSVTPILLINEADGLLSRRFDNPERSVEQTANTMQNILLEEMERFKGILLCTSNLVNNLDSAFERRFLFKIEFEKPGPGVKRSIWKSKLNWLADELADELAVSYDFSGGEIENVARKAITHEVLNGSYPDRTALIGFCEGEKIARSKRKQVGF